MSEEVQNIKPEETSAQETVSADTKKKKINKLSLDAVNKKIADMEEKKLHQSRYYIHLQERKRELENSAR